jgi:hypothetical protein
MVDITDFQIGQGETFKILLHIYTESTGSVLMDITNYNFEGQLRENYTTEEIAANFSIDKVVPFSSGSVFVVLPSTTTIQLEQRKYVYDVLMKDTASPPIVRRLLEGTFTVRPAVTK